jgi:glycine dehydrogenase subunit 2
VVASSEEGYSLSKPSKSIGTIRSFYASFGILLRAYVYVKTMGGEGLKEASTMAVLNANYLRVLLKDAYVPAYDEICMHEFVLDGLKAFEGDVKTLDVAKRIIDYGYHPPTVYFPLTVHNALMIEPTETEPIEVLDEFSEALHKIAVEAVENPELLHLAPVNAPVGRIDELLAAKSPVLTWSFK